MTEVKTDHTATGSSQEMASYANVVYHADFTTGTGVGTANFEVNIGGDWLVVASSSSDIALAVHAAGDQAHLRYRWNVTAYTSGTITTYMSN